MPYDLQESLVPKTERAATQLRAGRKLVLASRLWRSRLSEQLRASGQTDSTFGALYHLAAAPAGLIQAELADRLAITGASLVRQLEVLEFQGLITRAPIVGDRRARLVRLTPEGIQAIRSLDSIATTLRDDVFAGVSSEDLSCFDRVLDAVTATLSQRVAAERKAG